MVLILQHTAKRLLPLSEISLYSVESYQHPECHLFFNVITLLIVVTLLNVIPLPLPFQLEPTSISEGFDSCDPTVNAVITDYEGKSGRDAIFHGKNKKM